ncbi:hypothetical protein JK628_15225 [Shewanella sp. KX20019]|uniref:hypothetical protein n=1 Tax=Shewanella sp. KX20019 TaxID=2803864 RepID=UPI001926DF2F|nr:hypothetical protein [Shewanella sp. KX20019]QQX78907.1 hypothetical protein JK628_15225 [Shewanella sp. KX20019]
MENNIIIYSALLVLVVFGTTLLKVKYQFLFVVAIYFWIASVITALLFYGESISLVVASLNGVGSMFFYFRYKKMKTNQ